jgi:hypothetical protein
MKWQTSFFLDEKVLLLPVVYEKYNYLLLSMNFNAEFYKFNLTEKNFSKFETCSTTWFWFKISKRNWKVWDLVSAPLSDLENVLFDCVICETSSETESQKVYFNFNWKLGLVKVVLKYFKNELNFCKEFGTEDKFYCTNSTTCWSVYRSECLNVCRNLFNNLVLVQNI